MFSDGYAHSLEWFADTYKVIPVSREDFPAEKEKGLYWFTGDLLIPEGTEQIVFTYRNPDGALIQRENVFVVRDGEKGNPAPQYLGMFANPPAAREDNTPLQKGDTYLNKTDRNLYRYDGLDWIAVPDEDPGWWEALGDAVKEAAESGVQITAANAWVEKLVAGTVLAQKLFAKEITIPEGGVIQSQNFSEGTQGFRILGNGKIEINDGYLKSSDFTPSGTSGWAIGYPDGDNFATKTLNVESIACRQFNSLNVVKISNIKTEALEFVRHYSPAQDLLNFTTAQQCYDFFIKRIDVDTARGFSGCMRVDVHVIDIVEGPNSSSGYRYYTYREREYVFARKDIVNGVTVITLTGYKETIYNVANDPVVFRLGELTLNVAAISGQGLRIVGIV